MKDTLRIALPNEPGNGNAYMMTTTEQAWVGGAFAEPVTIIAKATLDDATLSGFTKWEEKSTSVWRLTLRDGVKFHNGEPWNAEAAKFNFDFWGNKANGTPNYAFLGDTTTKVIDDKTVEVTCKNACPIFPRFSGFLNMQAPGWYQKASDKEKATSNVGYGPLKHVEYRIGEVWKAERYDGYVPVPGLAEGQKPAIREVTWVFRAETAVRLAMLQTGEADLALRLDIDDADKMPAFVIGAEGSIIGFRADMLWNPLLAKKEIRQALAYAIDCPTMAKTFYRGYAECVGVPAPLGVLGVTEKNVKPLYDYNPAKARELLAKAGYKGEEVRLRMREGRFPKDVEVGEAIVSSWREVGINGKLLVMESSKWLELHTTGPGAFKKEDWPRLSQLSPPKPGLVSPDLLLAAPGNDTLDFGRNLAFYLDCRSNRSKICDLNLQLKVEAALAASGEERKRQIAEVMDILREELYMHSLFDAPFLWGTQKDLVFEPAVGGRRIQINT
ncbi:MAG: ABC transporter substrate-binding protein, partial [Chloroflexota bacterium]